MSVFNSSGLDIYFEWYPGSNGKTIAFLNGVMASTNSWVIYSAFFRERGYGVLLHDFQGQLRSDKPQGPCTFNEHTADLAALADHLGIESLHLAGTSYGGEVALQFAMDYPEKTLSLCIIDSVSETDALLDAFIRSWIQLAKKETAEAFYWSAVPSLYSSSFLSNHMDMLTQRAAAFKELPDDYFAGQRMLYENFLGIHMTAKLKDITCPALVVCGTDDILKPPKFSRLIAERIPSSRLVLLPDCGHVAIFEQPETLIDLLLGFLERLV